MGKKRQKQQPYDIANGALHWKKGPPYIQNINKVKEPEASRIAEKLKYSSSIRQLLCACYLNSSDKNRLGLFKGRVVAMKPVKRSGGITLLFKPIYVSYMRDDGKLIEGKEDHVWIQDNGAFKALGVQQGRCYAFNASVYLYKHSNTERYEFALEQCDNVRIIADSEMPDGRKLEKDMWAEMACEYCVKNLECDRKQCAEPEWRKQMSWGLSHPTSIEKKQMSIPMSEVEAALTQVVKDELQVPEVFTVDTVVHDKQQVLNNTQKKTWLVTEREVQSTIDQLNKIYANLHKECQVLKVTCN